MGKRQIERHEKKSKKKLCRSEITSFSSDEEDEEFRENDVFSEENEEEDAISLGSESDEEDEDDEESVSDDEEDERVEQEQEELRQKFYKIFDTKDNQKLFDRCKTFQDISEVQEWSLTDVFLFYMDRPEKLPIVVKNYRSIYKKYGPDNIIPDTANTIQTKEEIEFFFKYAEFMHLMILENDPSFDGLVEYIEGFPEHSSQCIESFFRIMKEKLNIPKFIKNEICQNIFNTDEYLKKEVELLPNLVRGKKREFGVFKSHFSTIMRLVVELIRLDNTGKFAKIMDECYDEPDMTQFFSTFLPYFEQDPQLIVKLIRKSPKPKTMEKMANVLLLRLRLHFAIVPILSHANMKDNWDLLSIMLRIFPTTKHLKILLETVSQCWNTEEFKTHSPYYLQLAIVNRQIPPIVSVMYFVRIFGMSFGANLVKDIDTITIEIPIFARYLQILPCDSKKNYYEFFKALMPSKSDQYNRFKMGMNQFFDNVLKHNTDNNKTLEIIKGIFMFIRINHIEIDHILVLSKSLGQENIVACLADIRKTNFRTQIYELFKTEMPDDPLTDLIRQTFYPANV